MVVFDLQCAAGHTFEGWFDDLKDLKSQVRRGLLTCPVCGESSVRQVPAGFAIARSKGGRRDEQQDMQRALGAAVRNYFINNFEDVGTGFAKEALKMHYGVSQARNIRGVSTEQEEKVLRREGVDFFKFAAPVMEGDPELDED